LFAHLKHKTQHQQLFTLAVPMILSNITVPLLGIVDTAVVGHLDKAYYLGATSIGATIITFVTWLCGFLRMSTTGLTAQSVGEENTEQNLIILLRGLLVAMAIGLIFVLLQSPYLHFSLLLAGGSDQVQYYAQQYSEIRIYGLPVALANLVLMGWLLGNHQAKSVMWLIILTNVVNVMFDLLFVLVFKWQVAGVAWATLISEYSGFGFGALVAYKLLRSTHQRSAIWPIIQRHLVNKQALGKYFRLNVDIILRTIALQLTFVFITFQGARLGDVVVAANAILLNFLLLISFGLDGIANAAEVMVGKASGAKNTEQLKLSVSIALFWTGIFAVLYSVFFALFGTQFVQLISTVTEVNTFAESYLVWIIWLPIVACWCYAFDGIYIGLMKAKIMRNSMIFSVLVCFYPVWFILQDYGNHALWAALISFMFARGITLAGHYYAVFNRQVSAFY
jgi:MATE family multidrug resistance protein